jgi:hypothetical protein
MNAERAGAHREGCGASVANHLAAGRVAPYNVPAHVYRIVCLHLIATRTFTMAKSQHRETEGKREPMIESSLDYLTELEVIPPKPGNPSLRS